MGAYLEKPIVEKITETRDGEGLKYGATSMQGWRVNQEDAHNCILSLVDDWNLFAVYDGHGGSEVSKFTAEYLPQFLKEREFWSAEDIVASLQEVFIDFDDKIRSPEAMKELKELASAGEGAKGETAAPSDSDDEGDRIETIEESRLPLDKLLARYGYQVISTNSGGSVVKQIVDSANEVREELEVNADTGEPTSMVRSVQKKRQRAQRSPDSQAKKAKTEKETNGSDEKAASNGEPAAKGPETGDSDADADTKVEKKITDPVEDSDSEDDADFVADEDPEAEESNEDEDVDEDDGVESDEVEGEDDEEADEEDEDQFMISGGMGEVPGDDSGTTACVMLMNKTKIVVANAGDSRAVLCRAGKAVDLSVDHKPEDEEEKTRIEKAGGTVNEDGRVNGGLNMSRALGDHCYKKNTDLPLKEQMISALPDVKVLERNSDDEFVVVACDGIWNSLESQQVVDFVKERLAKDKSPAQIAEELCDECLADSTDGDGTGCDNMTVIVIRLDLATKAES